MSIKAKEANPPLEGDPGTPGDEGPEVIRAIDVKRMEKDFVHFYWVEPSDYGDPVGPKGALGVAGSQSAYDKPDPLLLAIDYCKGIEREYVKLTKRLRNFAMAQDTNFSKRDSSICPIMRSSLVNLYNDLYNLHEQLLEIQHNGYREKGISKENRKD